MFVHSVRAENFRPFPHLDELELANVTTIVGRNDVGKSNVLRVLQLFFDELKIDESDVFDGAASDADVVVEVALRDLPETVELEPGVATSLSEERLTDADGYLRIRKTFPRSKLSKPTLTLVVRDFDDDALAAIWQQTETGDTGHTGLLLKPKTGSPRSGSLGSARSMKLLLAPTDADRDPWLVIYRAIPLVDESADLSFAIGTELGIAVVFYGIPDASDRVYAYHRREDITL